MRKLLKIRWFLLVIWLIVTILFAVNQPNLKKVLDEKGQITIDEASPSKVASKILNKMSTSKGDTLIFVFNDEKKISDEGMKDIENGINNVRNNKDKLKINSILDPFSVPEAKDRLLSKDGTTLMVQVTYERGTSDSEAIMKGFEDSIKDIKVEHYITGDLAINNDYLRATSKGVDKSSAITIAFILLVLILMFRSVATPLVSLFAVGASYLCSMGIIGILISLFDFPITSLTQMFVILVLFGIGTDYNVLLFNRFKEELGHGLSVNDAIVATYRTAGKTIIFSGLTVFIAFASLSFMKFPIYRSANAVAIGIAVLLLELMTLTPLLMSILAEKLFWPSHNSAGHKESKIWERVTSVSVKHPIVSLLVVIAIIAPVIFFGNQNLSYDSLKDMSADTPSVKGFNIVADKFGRGKAMPTTVVLESKDSMDNNNALSVIDSLTEKLKNLKGVKEVSGPTQPQGEAISDFYTSSQTKSVVEGLSATNDGVGKIQGGLEQIKSKLSAPDFSDARKLSDGTGAIQNGLEQISQGLQKVSGGIDQSAAEADKLTAGIAQVKEGVIGINSGIHAVSDNLAQIQDGFSRLSEGYKSLPGSINGLEQLVSQMELSIAGIDKKLPGDPDVAALKAITVKLSEALSQLSSGISQADVNYDQLASGLSKLNDGLKALIESSAPKSKLVMGIEALEQGLAKFSSGLKQGSTGQKKIIESMSQLKAGAGQVKAGQDALYSGLTSLSGGMSQLKDGISMSSDGLEPISDGLGKTNDFLTQLTNAKTFYIPKEAFGNADMAKMLDAYMSQDRKVAKLTVNLVSDPYSPDSIKIIDDIDTLVENHLKGTVLADAKYGVAGSTSITNDLNNIATHDIVFTQIIVLVCIFILLIIVIRSFWIPVYIVASLMAAYYTAISVTSLLTSKLYSGMDGMSWNVPFFSFVMIAALGVDYSIFLMTRYREYPELSPKDAVVMAAKHIGGVVMSAAVILAGTFATLYPSGLHVLMELSICVVTGLLLLSLILLPVVIPSLISIHERLLRKSDSVAIRPTAEEGAV